MATKKSNNSSIVPVIVVLVVLAAIIGTLAYLYKSSKPDPSLAANNSRSSSATPAPRVEPTIPANAPAGAALGINVKGQPDAAVTVEEFADFQCPSCASAYPVMKQLEDDFAGNRNVRFIFRQFPLEMHDKSYEAATAVEAAGMQGASKFWAMMDLMFTNQQTWATSPTYRDIWKGYAEKIGLDTAKFEADSAGVATKGRVDLDLARGRGVGVSSTPSVYVNGRLVPFVDVNVPTMKQIINAEIEKTMKPAATESKTGTGTTSANANAAPKK